MSRITEKSMLSWHHLLEWTRLCNPSSRSEEAAAPPCPSSPKERWFVTSPTGAEESEIMQEVNSSGSPASAAASSHSPQHGGPSLRARRPRWSGLGLSTGQQNEGRPDRDGLPEAPEGLLSRVLLGVNSGPWRVVLGPHVLAFRPPERTLSSPS